MSQLNLLQFKIQAVKAKIRKDTFENREYIVAPVIPIVEGVLNGFLVQASEFGKYVQAWNGIPVPINHPMKNGQYVSANQIDVLETNVVGRFFNAKMDGKRLKGELWVDIAKCNELGGEALQALQMLEKGEPLEVSTAYFSDDIPKSGIYNGKKYTAESINLRPDHLALLPNGTGACSWADGAGAPRVACLQEGGEDELEEENRLSVFERMRNFFLNRLGINEPSHEKTRQALSSALRDENNKSYYYIEEVWDNEFVYEQEVPTGIAMSSAGSKSSYYKRTYAIDNNGIAALAQEKQEVKSEKNWVPVLPIKVQEKEEKKPVTKKEIIEGLIANKGTKFEEKDREWLDKLEVNQLELLVPVEVPIPDVVVKPVESIPVPAVVPIVVPAVTPNVVIKPQTEAEFLAAMPEGEYKTMVINSLEKQKTDRVDLVKKLVANKKCTFSEDELKVMGIDQLVKLDSMLTLNNYSGKGLPRTNEEDDEIPEPPKVLLAQVEKK